MGKNETKLKKERKTAMRAEIIRNAEYLEYYKRMDGLPTVAQARQALKTILGHDEDLITNTEGRWHDDNNVWNLKSCLKRHESCGVTYDGYVIEFMYEHIYIYVRQ